MKRILILFFAVTFGLGAGILAAPAASTAGVSVNISIPLPGPIIPVPPPLIVVPGTYVYYPPEVGVDIFFYRGSWYRPYNGGWYIGGGYNGPWRSIAPDRVPRPLYTMPHDYRHIAPMHERMPYSTVRSNWRAWEQERHWDNGRPRGDREEHHGRGDRGEHGHGEGHGRGHGHGHDRD